MTAGQASGLSSTGSRRISRYSEDEIVRDVSTALDMTELLSSVAGRLCLSLCKRERIKVRDYSLWQEGLIEPSDSIFRLLTFVLFRLEEERRLLRLAPGSKDRKSTRLNSSHL